MPIRYIRGADGANFFLVLRSPKSKLAGGWSSANAEQMSRTRASRRRRGLGLDRVTRIELRKPVASHDLPIGAAGTHFALDAGPLEGPSGDVHDPSPAVRHLAKLGWRGDSRAQLEGKG